jgi:hypothetical protein
MPALPRFDFARLSMLANAERTPSADVAVGRADDAHEIEADRIAHAVAGDRATHGAAAAATPVPVTPHALDVVRSGGRALGAGARRAFERKTGYSLGNVRVHDDARAAHAARSIGAAAYTLGDHIVLTAPEHATGGNLSPVLAHELAHIVQQRRTPGAPPRIRRAPDPSPPPGSTQPPSSSNPVMNELDRWKRLFTEKRYGCFCGPGHVCETPIDTLDRCCQAHDLAYDKVGVSSTAGPGQVDMWTAEGLMRTEDADAELVACSTKTFFEWHWYGPAATAYRVFVALIFGARVLAAKFLRAHAASVQGATGAQVPVNPSPAPAPSSGH